LADVDDHGTVEDAGLIKHVNLICNPTPPMPGVVVCTGSDCHPAGA